MTSQNSFPPSPAIAAATPAAASPGERLVVVDDDPDIRALIRAQLERETYTVAEAGSVQSLRETLRAGPVDLIVLDLGLPDGDGLLLARDLRAEGYQGQIIMVTARDSPIDRVLGLELGADDYLVKPFEPRELLARVRNLLRRARHAATNTPTIAPGSTTAAAAGRPGRG